MKAVLKFVFCFFMILLFSAILAPFLYRVFPKLSEYLSQYFSFVNPDAFDWKFERIYNRLVMIFSLVTIFYAVRKKKIHFPKEIIQWNKKTSFRLFVFGFGWGVLLIMGIIVIKFVLGIVELRIAKESFSFWLERVGMSLLAAMLIGIIEEIFFRGFCFVTVLKRTKQNLLASIFIVNIFYAILHYIQGKKPFVGPDPSIVDGLKLMAAPFMSLANWQPILPGIIGLFIYGAILSGVYLKTRSLYPCIGIHAGCVFLLKVDGALFFYHAVNPLLYGSNNGYDGVLGWITLLVLGAAILAFFSRKTFTPKLVMVIFFGFLLTSSNFCFAQTSVSSKEEIDTQNDEPLSALEMWKRKKQMLDKYEPKTIENDLHIEKEITSEGKLSQEIIKEKIDEKEVQLEKKINNFDSSRETLGLERKLKSSAIENRSDVGNEKAFFETKNKSSSSGALDLVKNLAEAKIVNIDGAYQNTYGIWKDKAFLFKDNEAATIEVQEQLIGGEIQKGVHIEALANTIRRIRFEGVETGQILVLNYGMADNVFQKDENLTIYLKVWVGKKLLKRIPIFNEKGWKKEEIDLGSVAFLRSPISVTFDLIADDVQNRHLILDAKIH